MGTIRPRPFPISSFADAIPRHWIAGSLFATHVANGVNLLFPAGERFFVRSVRHYKDRIAKDPQLAEAVQGFAGQEGHHARAHEAFFEVMERQGLEIQPFLRVYEKLAYGVLEPMFPPVFRLATTAAAEHFTALMAENFLSMAEDRQLHPLMERLLIWHACEEIEHRSVAFDVFERIDGRYSVRMAGLAIATVTLAGFWIAAALYLMAQEKGAVEAVRRDLRVFRKRQPIGREVFLRGLRSYARRDFHPSKQKHLDALLERTITQLEGFISVAA
ncbi:MAG: metal-dependent hydrolase [Polyangiaceae bacterium]|nr:metal-dependent hydrolase [Polyangiaceae bacterium]